MGLTGAKLPPTPKCPQWCAGHEEGAYWQVHRAAITKICRRTITVSDGTHSPVELLVERFASVEDGVLVVAAPKVRVACDDALPMCLARLLADTLARVAELVHEPEKAA